MKASVVIIKVKIKIKMIKVNDSQSSNLSSLNLLNNEKEPQLKQ